LDEGFLQLELIDFQSSDDLRQLLQQAGFESSFSHMNAIKTHNRISLTDQHLQHCLRIALTTYTPDFTALAKSKKCNFSH